MGQRPTEVTGPYDGNASQPGSPRSEEPFATWGGVDHPDGVMSPAARRE